MLTIKRYHQDPSFLYYTEVDGRCYVARQSVFSPTYDTYQQKPSRRNLFFGCCNQINNKRPKLRRRRTTTRDERGPDRNPERRRTEHLFRPQTIAIAVDRQPKGTKSRSSRENEAAGRGGWPGQRRKPLDKFGRR